MKMQFKYLNTVIVVYSICLFECLTAFSVTPFYTPQPTFTPTITPTPTSMTATIQIDTKNSNLIPQDEIQQSKQLMYTPIPVQKSAPHVENTVQMMSGNDTNTKLLLHFNSNFADSSSSGHNSSGFGNAAISNSQKKFGDGSLFLDGNGDYISVPDHADWDLGTGDYTVDFWIQFITLKDWQVFFEFGNSGTPGSLRLAWGTTLPSPNNEMRVYEQGGIRARCVYLFNTSQWYHIAVVRNNGTSLLFIDGTLISTVNDYLGTVSVSDMLLLGRRFDGYYVNGYFDEFRISNIARWTSNFSPPTEEYSSGSSPTNTPTAVNPSITPTFTPTPPQSALPDPVAWWKLDETNGDTVIDTMLTHPGVRNGALLNQPGRINKAYSFDGNDDNILISDFATIDFNTSHSYTVSLWFKTTTTTGNRILIAKDNGSGGYPINLILATDNKIYFYMYDGSAAPNVSTNFSVNDGEWHHVVAVRNVAEDRIFIYLDGVLHQSTTDTVTNSIDNNDSWSIGNGDTNYVNRDYTGNIDDVRIYNQALTASEIVILFNYSEDVPEPVSWWRLDDETSGPVVDTMGNHNGTVYGNPNYPVAGKVWSSFAFDGVEDCIRIGDHAMYCFGNGTIDIPFSIVAWIKPDRVDYNGQFIISKWPNGTNVEWLFQILTTGKLAFSIYDASALAQRQKFTNSALTAGNWTFIAATYDGRGGISADEGIKLYVDGSETGTTSNNFGSYTSMEDTTSPVDIGTGNQETATITFDGNIDEVRIYNSELTLSQIQTIYNNDLAGGSPQNTPTYTPLPTNTSLPTHTPTFTYTPTHTPTNNPCNTGTNIFNVCNFPDPYFRIMIQQYMGTSTFTAADAATKSGAWDFDAVSGVGDGDITDLTGIEFFTGLTSIRTNSSFTIILN